MKLSSTDKEALEIVKTMLESNIADCPSLKLLCTKSGLNSNKLKRGFRIIYGLPPYSYLRILRMKEAQRLLLETELSVREIAWAVGFEQVNGFCKAFKRFSGERALQWRIKYFINIKANKVTNTHP